MKQADLGTLVTIRDTRVPNSSLRSQRVVGRGAPRDVTTLRCEVVAIFGPTASGKSAVARLVADALGTDVVSADALQVYRGLPILTNQPTEPTLLVGGYAQLSYGFNYYGPTGSQRDEVVLVRKLEGEVVY